MDYRVRTWWVEGTGTRVSLEVERNKARQTLQLTLLPRSDWSGGGGAPAAAAPAPAPAAARPAASAPRPASTTASAGAKSGTSGVELKPGMTELEVARLLGPPKEKVAFGAKSLWRYDGYSITFQNGRVTDMN
jgi:hypothetical protein